MLSKAAIVCINYADQNRFEIKVSVLNKRKFWHVPVNVDAALLF
jgi:hypothetical protein